MLGTPLNEISLRDCSTGMMTDKLRFRKATFKDKRAVLGLRNDMHVTDDLQHRFEGLLCDVQRLCILGQLGDEVALFVVVLFADNGSTAFLHSARVRQGWEGRGYYRQALELIDRLATKKACSGQRFEVLTDNRFLTTERFKKHFELKMRIKNLLREIVPGMLHSPLPAEELRPVTQETMLQFLSDRQLREYLFPEGLMAINKISYRAEVSNIRFLFDGCVRLYHNVRTENGRTTGLLSSIAMSSCSASVLLNVIGRDEGAVESHIRFHCKHLCDTLTERAFFELETTSGFDCKKIASVLDSCGLQLVQEGCYAPADIMCVERSYISSSLAKV